MSCQSGYKFPASGLGQVDMDDVFVRKEYFSEGGLWLWGSAADGQLGDNSVVPKSSPVQAISGGTNWKQIDSTLATSAGLKSDGTLWNWGNNGGLSGRLGDNTTTNRSSPVQTVSGGTNWRYLAIGAENGIGIKTDGTLWIWGANDSGKLGNNLEGGGSADARSSPIQTIAGGTNWKMASGGDDQNAAIKTDGTLWLWGLNSDGRLGDDSVINKSSPVQTVSGGTNWSYVALGTQHTTAIKSDGTLWIWGRNTDGRLGDNSTINASSPIQTISGGTNWKKVSAGSNHTAAIKTDGTLWVWGSGAFGQLGTNTLDVVSSPVQTVSGGTNWKEVSAGFCNTGSIKTDGTLWLWGLNAHGQLGDNTNIPTSSPIQTISGGTNWKQVSTKGCRTVALREDCW